MNHELYILNIDHRLFSDGLPALCHNAVSRKIIEPAGASKYLKL